MINETDIKNINKEIQSIFETTVNKMIQDDIIFVVPAFYPQRAGIVRDIIAKGGKVIIAGGTPGQTLFKGAYQVSPFETTGLIETTDNIQAIVNAIPTHMISGKKVALFVEAAIGTEWSDALKSKGADIVLSNEQNLRSFFEEKSNLETILKTAGLTTHFIPSQVVVADTLSYEQAADLYHTYKNQDNGKIVLQSCGAENVESGGGKGTCIADNFDTFYEMFSDYTGHVKVATFVDGLCSNMSMFVGNTIADKENGSVQKGVLTGENPFDCDTLSVLLDKGQSLGITDDKIIVQPARATLKVIGDNHLTNSDSNGVGNSLGHNFPDTINQQVWEIAQKLGHLMAKCGKVGLCGTDLIIDKNGHIWINEVNDRQQGPTEQLSLDAESSGLVGIYRLAFVTNYADCSKPQVQKTLYKLQKSMQSIYEASLEIDGSFYIKMMGKEPQTTQVELSTGVYKVTQNAFGEWHWDLSKSLDKSKMATVDLNHNEAYLVIQCDLPKGQEMPVGSQILRIVGKAKNGFSPFIVQNGKGVLNPKWVPIVNALRNQIFQKQKVVRSNGLQQQIIAHQKTHQRGG